MGKSILDEIMNSVAAELATATRARPISELQRMVRDAPPVRSFAAVLRGNFGLIAEIKRQSPSAGQMRPENVARAPAAYQASPCVFALSVLTNRSHFGMSIEDLARIRATTTKPILRKDFIVDEYQVWEARAFGADAILLMANLLDAERLDRLWKLASELGLDVLFECHTAEQIARVPHGATVYGINTRNFDATPAEYEHARTSEAGRDRTTDLGRLELGRLLPAHAVKVAESGIRATDVPKVRAMGVYNAMLVGTTLLKSPLGIERELAEFGKAIMAGT